MNQIRENVLQGTNQLYNLLLFKYNLPTPYKTGIYIGTARNESTVVINCTLLLFNEYPGNISSQLTWNESDRHFTLTYKDSPAYMIFDPNMNYYNIYDTSTNLLVQAGILNNFSGSTKLFERFDETCLLNFEEIPTRSFDYPKGELLLPLSWSLTNGYLKKVPGTVGSLRTKDQYSDCHFHVEFKCSSEDTSNSGLYIFERCEMQIANTCSESSFETCGALFNKRTIGSVGVNAFNQKDGFLGEHWNSYDIFWQTWRVNQFNTIVKPALLVACINGIVVHKEIFNDISDVFLGESLETREFFEYGEKDGERVILGGFGIQDHIENFYPTFKNIFVETKDVRTIFDSSEIGKFI